MNSDSFFFCYLPRSTSWPLSWNKNEKAVQARLEALTQQARRISNEDSNSSDGNDSGKISPKSPCSPKSLSPQALSMLNRPITYVWPTGGLTVQPGVQEIGADLYRVHPYVHSRDKTAIVLFGYVSNVADLVGRKVAEKRLQIDTGLEADDGDGGCDGGGPPTPTGNHDVGRLTASAILQLYLDSGPGNEKVVLSELQGAYAFVILDSSKKQAFAARDPSGGETLYYLLDDGAASFTHSLEALPPSELRAAWQELPPGHFIAGKPPRLQQFALTREQLMARDRQESMQSDEIAFFGEL